MKRNRMPGVASEPIYDPVRQRLVRVEVRRAASPRLVSWLLLVACWLAVVLLLVSPAGQSLRQLTAYGLESVVGLLGSLARTTA